LGRAVSRRSRWSSCRGCSQTRRPRRHRARLNVARISPSAVCAASAQAIGEAFRIIQCGDADVSSPVARRPVRTRRLRTNRRPRFVLFRNVARDRPFLVYSAGFVLGEGAAVLVLEALDDQPSSRRRAYAEICGCGLSADAFHATAPLDDMRAALGGDEERLRLRRRSRHAATPPQPSNRRQSTPRSDRASRSPRRQAPPATFSGPVPLELVTVLARHLRLAPPTHNLLTPLFSGLYFTRLEARPLPSHHGGHLLALSNKSFGFGGVNTPLALASSPGTSRSDASSLV